MRNPYAQSHMALSGNVSDQEQSVIKTDIDQYVFMTKIKWYSQVNCIYLSLKSCNIVVKLLYFSNVTLKLIIWNIIPYISNAT